jgi:hypothetical protein
VLSSGAINDPFDAAPPARRRRMIAGTVPSNRYCHGSGAPAVQATGRPKPRKRYGTEEKAE